MHTIDTSSPENLYSLWSSKCKYPSSTLNFNFDCAAALNTTATAERSIDDGGACLVRLDKSRI